MKSQDLPNTLLSTIVVIVFIVLLLTLITSEINHYNNAQNLVMSGIHGEIEALATYAANSIPWDLHEKIRPGDELSDNFIKLNSIIKLIADNYPRASYIYTIRKDGDSFYFVLDSDEEEAWNIGEAIGVPVDVVPDALLLAFTGVFAHTDDFYTDEWGSFISGYAPIFSPSGEVVAVLAVDVSEDLVSEEIERVREEILVRISITTIIGLIASLIGIYATLYLLNSHKLTKSAQDLLLQATNAAQEGAFEYDPYNDTFLCGLETAQLFGYNIEPGIETYALSKDFIVGKAVYEDKKSVDEHLNVSNKRIEHTKFAYSWRFHVDNKIKAIRFKGYISQNKGRVKIIGMAEDYTEQERNKGALINTNKKIQILHSISSHDIRNIFTAIYSYADLILEEEVSDDIKVDIKELIQSSEDSTFAISNFSKIYSTLGTSLPEWINIKTLANDIFEAHPDLKHITFTNNINNVYIYADPHTNFVIQTLFEFSMQYCDCVTNVVMHTSISSDVLHIIYQDDGVGICDDNKETLFDFDVTKKDRNVLYIAREILAITDISIIENGCYGNGTQFVIAVKPGWFQLEY